MLGWVLVAGLYADGWAHGHVPGLETFFTPWHAVLYGSFVLLAAWSGVLVLRRLSSVRRWRDAVPAGYGGAWVGIGVFAAGGLADMTWHIAFGVETGLSALLSPTHLVLLAGGLLLLSPPLRAQPSRAPRSGWPAVLSLSASVALVAFFLSYVSVFTDPGAVVTVLAVPEGAPGHREAELPAVAGLGGYLVTTLLLVVPLLYLYRRTRLPGGAVTALVAAVAVPGAVLSDLEVVAPALAAVAGAAVLDLTLFLRRRQPPAPAVAVAGLLPLLVWAGQLSGLAGTGRLAWPTELWLGVVVLTALLAVLTALLSQPPLRRRDVEDRTLTAVDHQDLEVRRTS